VGLGLLVAEGSRSHSDTPHSAGLLCASDKPDAEKLYLTTSNTHKRQKPMPRAGFEPAIQAGERPHIHPLDGAAAVLGAR